MNEALKRNDVRVGVAVVVIILIVLLLRLGNDDKKIKQNDPLNEETQEEIITGRVVGDSSGNFDLANKKYVLNGKEVILVDGSYEVKSLYGVVKSSLLEGPAFADLNGDGVKDAVVIIRNDNGSEILYYLSAVLAGSTEQNATNSILLGDRIRIKEISVDNGIVSVSILDRAEGETKTIAPSVLVTKTYKIVDGSLVESN